MARPGHLGPRNLRCAGQPGLPLQALKPQASRLSRGPQLSSSPGSGGCRCPTEVLSCQPKFLVKPLVDKASGQIGSSLPARPRPPPSPRSANRGRSRAPAAGQQANGVGSCTASTQPDTTQGGGRSWGAGGRATWDLRPGVEGPLLLGWASSGGSTTTAAGSPPPTSVVLATTW